MTKKRYSFEEFSKIIIDILDKKDGISTRTMEYFFKKKRIDIMIEMLCDQDYIVWSMRG